MVVICNIYEAVEDLLPHFYLHYCSRGVDRFLFAVHRGQSNPCWNRIHELNTLGLRVELIPSYDESINGEKEGQSLEALRQRVPPNEWYIPTDLDEFHILDGHTFPQIAKTCQSEDAEYVRSQLCDRVAEGGRIPPHIEPRVPILSQFPRQCDITRQVLKACADKVCFARAHVRLNNGHHHPVGHYKPLARIAQTHHFKWFGDLYTREKEKLDSYRNSGFPYYLENQRLLDYLDLHEGKLL